MSGATTGVKGNDYYVRRAERFFKLVAMMTLACFVVNWVTCIALLAQVSQETWLFTCIHVCSTSGVVAAIVRLWMGWAEHAECRADVTRGDIRWPCTEGVAETFLYQIPFVLFLGVFLGGVWLCLLVYRISRWIVRDRTYGTPLFDYLFN